MLDATLFISAVSEEFGEHRKRLRHSLDLPGLRVETQESFLSSGVPSLVAISNYVRDCDSVIQLVGECSGNVASAGNRRALLEQLPDLPTRLSLDKPIVDSLTYTQWEAWLALYHGKRLHLAPAHVVGASYSMRCHLDNLQKKGHYPADSLRFRDSYELVEGVLRSLHFLFSPQKKKNIPIYGELPPTLGERFKGRAERLVCIASVEFGRNRGMG